MDNETTLADWLERCRRYKDEVGHMATAAALRAMGRHLAAYEQHRRESDTKDNDSDTICKANDTIYNKCTRARLVDIDRDFCEGFVDYLSRAGSLKNGHKSLSPHTQHHYMVVLKAALNMAVSEGMLAANPMRRMRREKCVRLPDTQRVYLDREELRRMLATPFPDDQTRRAFLFSCFCGLRISDIRRLTWAHLHPTADVNGRPTFRLSIVMQKTQHVLSFILSQEAMRCLPSAPPGTEGYVFRLPSAVSVNRHVRQWATRAGFAKHICFHTARHTFATMALTLGVDIFTTSKLLGHTNVTTTQVYARVVDRKKDAAMLLFDQCF